MAEQPAYLLNRDGRFFARIVIPAALRSYFDGRRELRTALGPDRREAKKKLHTAVASLQHQIGLARREHELSTGKVRTIAPYPLSAEEIALRDYRSQINFDAELRATDHRYATFEVDADEARLFRDGFAGKLSDDELDELVGHRVRRAELRGNTTAVKGTAEWRSLAQAFCVASYEAMGRAVERSEGDFNGKPQHPLLANASGAKEDRDPVSIKGLLVDYLAELSRGGRGAEARRRWTPVFADLIWLLGHDDANRLTKGDLLRWKDHLAKTLAPRTIRDVHLASLRAVLKWAKENDRITDDPSASVRQKLGKTVRSREKGFRDDEAVAILTLTLGYRPGERESAPVALAKKWASVLCAFTGARIVEITQLRKQDIRMEGETPVMRITPEAGSVKTAEYRDVPIHPQLVELGFLDFVADAADGPLFHASQADKALSGARTSAGRVSNWLRASGLIPEGVPPNHGWRHRFKTVGQEVGIDGRILDAIQGHSARTAGEHYGDVTLTTKAAAINKLPRYIFDQ